MPRDVPPADVVFRDVPPADVVFRDVPVGDVVFRDVPLADVVPRDDTVLTRRGITLLTAQDTWQWGSRLGALLRAGDLVVLTGELGAGKTTLAQGIADGLGVRGPITSPTFVIARVHPSLVGGPDLVHVDAYRLGGVLELDDLDLDTSLDEAVTIVEWGHGLAEQLSEDYLELTLRGNRERTVEVGAHGPRWATAAAVTALDALVLPP